MLYVCYFLAAALVVGLDQLVKWLVIRNISLFATVPVLPGVVHLTHIRNTGAAFSMLSGQRWPLVVITLACMALVVWLLVKGGLPRLGNWCLVAVLGGAVGNLIDRLVNGYVVDMIEVEFIRFPVFNVADIFVVCGGILLCISVLASGWGKNDAA